MEPLLIQSSRGPYTVHFEDDLAALASRLGSRSNVLIVLDETVAASFAKKLEPLLSKRPWISIRATEEEKTLGGCEKILEALVKNNANRDTRIIAIGGGIIQDLVTLCAHLYFRGIEWVYLPTTMLAMADSCVGAKASINFQGFKNQLGVFHSPAEVHVCPDFLSTLPEEQLRSGYGEAFKLHFVSSPRRFFDLAEKVQSEGWNNPSLASIIRESLEIKKGYIEADEFDQGIRRHLNYGHTFGHALESITDHGIPHGLAICWGMDLINYLSLTLGRIDEALFGAVHARLRQFFSWKLRTPIALEPLLLATKRDKKSTNGQLSLVMPGAAGALEIVRQDYTGTLSESIQTYLQTYSLVLPQDF
jgi:3-dehydroquinate synthase